MYHLSSCFSSYRQSWARADFYFDASDTQFGCHGGGRKGRVRSRYRFWLSYSGKGHHCRSDSSEVTVGHGDEDLHRHRLLVVVGMVWVMVIIIMVVFVVLVILVVVVVMAFLVALVVGVMVAMAFKVVLRLWLSLLFSLW